MLRQLAHPLGRRLATGLARLLAILLVFLVLPPSLLAAVEKTLHVEWEYDTSLPGLAGYNIYQDGALVFTVTDPQLLTADFTATFLSDTAVFTMTAFDVDGNESPPSDPYTVTLPPGSSTAPQDAPPMPDFTATPRSGDAPLEVRFDGSGSVATSGTLVRWDWDFGDGATASGAQASHTYTAGGLYTVRLTVTDDSGRQASTADTVTVNETTSSGNLKPLAAVSADPLAGDAPLEVRFDASASVDSDGRIVSYTWSFGDGATASGAQVSHTYIQAGIYTATVTVVDDEGASAAASVIVTVQAVDMGTAPPIPVLTADATTVFVGQGVSFDASQSEDPDGGQIAAHTWNFGDGDTASGSFVQHSFALEGTYTVRLTVTDDEGVSRQASIQVTVLAQDAAMPPTASQPFSGGITVNGGVIDGLVLEVFDAQGSKVGTYPVEHGSWLTDPLPGDAGAYRFVARYGDQTREVVPGQVTDWTLQFRSLSGTIRGVPTSETVMVVVMSRQARLLQGIRLAGGATVSYRFDRLLPAADWLVSAVVRNKPVLYYDGAYTETSARAVDLSAGDATAIDFDFAIPAPAAVSGVVQRDGAAVPGAPVYAYNLANGALQMSTTDANGGYSLALAGGRYLLFTTVEGRTYYHAGQGVNQNLGRATPVELSAGTRLTGVDFVLASCSYQISGQVTEVDTGKGIAGAQISVRGEQYAASAFTAADGSYRIGGLCEDTYTVYLLPTAAGHPVQSRSAALGPDQQAAVVGFTVGGGHTLSGTVSGADTGQPLAGALVYLRSEPDGRLFGYRYFQADAQGGYAIHDIPTGTYTLFVDHPDYQRTAVAGVTLDKDLVRDLSLVRGGLVTGTVADSAGQPLAGRLVVVQPQGHEPLFGRSDGAGAYRIGGVPLGVPSYVMVQRADGLGYQVHPTPVTATADGVQVDFTVSAEAGGFSLQGTVSTACDNAPVANARIVLSFAGSNGFFFRIGRTDASGAYAFADLPAVAGYRLVVEPAGGLRPVVVEPIDGSGGGSAVQDVAVPCGKSIAGSVIAPATGGPVYVVLFDSGHNYVDHQVLRVPGADGSYTFSFDNLADGEYKLAVSASGLQPRWYDGAGDFAGATPVQPGGPPLQLTLGQ